MTTLTPEQSKRWRQIFRRFNQLMLLLWRLGLGRWLNIWPAVGGRIMVIKHRGRKSGLVRLTPVNYAPLEGDIYCTAGFGRQADWYANLMANPAVELWLPDGRWSGHAADVTGVEGALARLRQVLVASGFAAYAAGIDPRRISDEALAAVSADYRLIRIRLVEPVAGPGGPGDLAWVWLPLAFAYWLWRLQTRRAART